MDLFPERLEDNFRVIRVDAGECLEAPTVSNEVRASKYSALAFLPLTLTDQLFRVSSLWFLLVILCEVNPVHLDFSTAVACATVFVLHLTANVVLAGVAMRRCRAEERSINAQAQEVWRGEQFESVPSEEVRVGDCLLVSANVKVPADLILLATSAETGTCHISTIRTLGESSLEVKAALRETQRTLLNEESPKSFNFGRFQATVRVEPPNHDFLSFSGTIKLRHFPRAVPLKPDNFVLKGSLLQGESWILGLVVYTGMETKYWSNVMHPARRITFVERFLNHWIAASALFVLSAAAIGYALQYALSQNAPQADDFLYYLSLYHSIVPVYFFVALDFLRLAQGFLSSDSEATVHSSCRVEDLGKVGFVLADKTGTVTKDHVELLAVLIGNQLYSKEPIVTVSEAEDEVLKLEAVVPTCIPQENIFSFADLQSQIRLGVSIQPLRRFCECVALCNSVIPMPDDSFLGTSVDEAALMQGATELGFSLCDRTPDSLTILVFEECVPYEIIAMKKFSPDVKCTRILVKQEIDPFSATLFIKGSYKALQSKLALNQWERTMLEQRLRLMSRKGLRTMVLCCRELSGDYLTEIESRVMTIKSSRNSQNVEGNLEVLLMELESDLTFLGVTGVRDHLQEGAEEAIETLRTAGIATWLLSGEEESHTLACARELGLIQTQTSLVSFDSLQTVEDCLLHLSKTVNELQPRDPHMTEASGISPASDTTRAPVRLTNFSLSLDGTTLKTAIKNEETQRLLLYLLLSANAVCFNTMHPSHKREAVQLLQEAVCADSCILAVGDGVSDIPMQLAADLSVGICHEESEATADISARSFAELPRLILRDGRRSTAVLLQAGVLFIYSEVLMILGVATTTLLADFTPLALLHGDTLVFYEAVLVFLPVLSASVQSNPLRTSAVKQMQLKQAASGSGVVSLARELLLAGFQFLGIAGVLYAACLQGSATVVTGEELTFFYTAAVSATVVVRCLMEMSSKAIPHAVVTVCAGGSLYVFYGASDEGASVLVAFFRTPRLVLGLLACVLISSVFSLAMQNSCLLRDVQEFASGKVTPLPLREGDLRHAQKISKSLLHVYSSPGINTDPKDRYEVRRAAFVNTQTESRFQRIFLRANRKLYWTLLSGVVLQALVPFLVVVAPGTASDFEVAVLALVLSGVCLLMVAFAVGSVAHLAAQVFTLVLLIVSFVLNILLQGQNSHLFFYVTVCLLLFLREKWLTNCALSALATLMLRALLLICSEISAEMTEDGLECGRLVRVLGIVIVQVFTFTLAAKISYEKAVVIRGQFQLIEESNANIEQSSAILGYLLPEFVCSLVKDGLNYTAENQGDVSILFIDICMFDHICVSYSPPELITLLDDIFQRIDGLCSSLHVAKIETVGKTYLACAGLRDFEFTETGEYSTIPHAKRALDLAFAVLRNFRNTKLMHGHLLSFKIGICSGPVIAGVVGYHKPQFVLVGDTVNTASRMASTCREDDTVHIAESTHKLVANRPEFSFQAQEMEVKGKGRMKTYVVKNASKCCPREIDSPSRSSTHKTVRHNHSILSEATEILKEVRENTGKSRCFSCALTEQERDFRLQTQLRLRNRIRLGLLQFALGTFALFVVRTLSVQQGDELIQLIPTVLFAMLSVIASCFLFFFQNLIRRPVLPWLLASLYCAASIAVGVDRHMWNVMQSDFTAMLLGFLLVVVTFSTALLFRSSVAALILTVLPHIWTKGDSEALQRAIFFFIFALQLLILQFATERSQRAFFRTSKLAKREIEKTEQLLTHMIPVHAYEGLRQGQWSTDRLYDTTILFADISGFTSWSSTHTPAKVIEKLTSIFTAFDKICVRMELYKVCTIGDCYVALSSTSNGACRNPGEECVRMVRFAFEMAAVIEDICKQDGEQLKMRIGLHVGEVVAGITGSHIVRYDIYGPDVVVANKMESSGAVGRVNVSGEAKALLQKTSKSPFQFEFNARLLLPEIEREAEAFFVTVKGGNT